MEAPFQFGNPSKVTIGQVVKSTGISYYCVKPGLNMLLTCMNSSCSQFSKKVIDCNSFSNIDGERQLAMNYVVYNTKCPACNQKANKNTAISCYFYECTYKCEGLDTDEEVFDHNWKVVSNGNYYFLDGEKYPKQWNYLTFFTKKNN